MLKTDTSAIRTQPSKVAGENREKGEKGRCKGVFPFKCGVEDEENSSPALTANGVVWVPKEACAAGQSFSQLAFYHSFSGYFLSRGRKTLNGRLITPVQERVMVLPPSVQVWVPLRSAWRRTNVPLYFASY